MGCKAHIIIIIAETTTSSTVTHHSNSTYWAMSKYHIVRLSTSNDASRSRGLLSQASKWRCMGDKSSRKCSGSDRHALLSKICAAYPVVHCLARSKQGVEDLLVRYFPCRGVGEKIKLNRLYIATPWRGRYCRYRWRDRPFHATAAHSILIIRPLFIRRCNGKCRYIDDQTASSPRRTDLAPNRRTLTLHYEGR